MQKESSEDPPNQGASIRSKIELGTEVDMAEWKKAALGKEYLIKGRKIAVIFPSSDTEKEWCYSVRQFDPTDDPIFTFWSRSSFVVCVGTGKSSEESAKVEALRYMD